MLHLVPSRSTTDHEPRLIRQSRPRCATLGATATPAGRRSARRRSSGATATLNLDGADDNVTVSVSGGLLVHGQTTGGLNSGTDWDSATDGDQTVPADGTFTVIVNGGAGNDSITVLAKNTELASSALNGEGGDDVLTGADSNDTLDGGDGNDRLVGGEGRRRHERRGRQRHAGVEQRRRLGPIDGDAGNDAAEVNGAPTLGDVFTLEPNAGGIKFQRTNLVPFTLDASTERFQVNGLGGNDSITANDGVGALTLLSVDGGAGVDTVNGSDGPDLILGGEGNDVLNGGGGDDRIVGDRGNDTMNGGAGDDTLVWNNGDGTRRRQRRRRPRRRRGQRRSGGGRRVHGPAQRRADQVRPHEPRAVLDRHRLQRDAARQRPRRRRRDHRRRGRRLLGDRAPAAPATTR